jgi:hypothetical protein
MINSIRTRFFYRTIGLLGALVLAIAALPHAMAGTIQGSYEVAIASSERLLNALDVHGIDSLEYQEIQLEESCDNPHYRVRARNKPAVLIQNRDSSEGALSSFTMTINLAAYLFGAGGDGGDGFDGYIKRSAYADPGVDIIGSSVSPDGQRVTVNFDGLTAGKSVIFRVDIDVDSNPIYADLFPFPDFRSVLFDMDDEGDPTEHTGTTTATFSADGMSSTTSESPLVGKFDMEWEGENTRPYHVVDPIIPGGGGGGIPEPSSLLLMLTGLVSSSMLRRTKR